MKNKKYVYSAIVLTTLSALVTAIPALADNTAPTTTTAPSAWGNGSGRGMMNRGGRGMMKPGVFGTVSAVSGNTITVSGEQGFSPNAVATTFTVDATNAKIVKNSVVGLSTISNIAVGDFIMAQGTLTGNNLVATMIRDGQPGIGNRGGGNNSKNGNQSGKISPVSLITGNGQPVVAGNVSAVNGSTLTITNKSNVSYTVDVTNAKIVQGQNTILVSNVVVGDSVIVQGAVNGNDIVASSIIDQARPAGATTGTTATTKPHQGFFAGVGSFFAHIFGF
jgi:hypothetical protein